MATLDSTRKSLNSANKGKAARGNSIVAERLRGRYSHLANTKIRVVERQIQTVTIKAEPNFEHEFSKMFHKTYVSQVAMISCRPSLYAACCLGKSNTVSLKMLSDAIKQLVVRAPTLALGIQYVEQTFGCKMQPDGQHSRMGTHNALLKIGDDCYLKVISVEPDAEPPQRNRWIDSATVMKRRFHDSNQDVSRP